MPYSHRIKTYLYLGFLVLIIIILHYTTILHPLENIIRRAILPATTIFHTSSIQINNRYGLFSDRKSFVAQCEKFRGDSEQKSALEAKMQTIYEENIALKQQLNFKEKSKLQITTAEVVGRDLDNINKTLLINQGSASGIQIGQGVITDSGVLIGKIIKIEQGVSVVGLVSDNQTRISALVLNKDRSLGAVEGGRGLSLTMKFIPRNEVVAVGDQVVTSGFESNIPRGILIGTIAVVENEAYKPFQQAVLIPAADLSKIILVGVLAGN
ncbi:MAG: rod shape-determining protein MreC [Candidatus Magasanikbacteria bacterium RIFOXYA2_FULL_44_8]|uniref:Cell shape-determining protein MreC n=1 Tax=Candidatus Magasanikbacteria bacterium RIFOXYA2_FULL_44_8 TaxID=1798696 RepID=A0A1F6NIW7_9BACT|nr:MAG: rod shape-determining protein MreC [Candidatus Magasanikbacteria bacterium RIFOXYA2_FULL_44_8]